MSDAAHRPDVTAGVDPERFRQLPDAVRLEDTVTSVDADRRLGSSDEPNDFIAQALNAGG